MARSKPATNMTPEQLREICELLYVETYGERWQTAFAEDLGRHLGREVRNGTVHQWLSGKRTVPPWLRKTMTDMVFAHQVRLVERSQQLYAKGIALLAEARDMAIDLGSLPPPPEQHDDRHEDLGDVPAKPKPAPARKPKRALETSK
ncbi:MAG: hypothetical protein MIL41_20400 [Hyphomicrobiales bacterium]